MKTEKSKQWKDRPGKSRITIRAIFLIMLSLSLLIMQVNYMKSRKEISWYLENSTAFCPVPDLDAGYIPQGMSYDPKTDSVILTGYFGQGGNSPIYVINQQRKSVKKILMLTESNERFQGHAGGLSLYKGRVYIAGSTAKCMYGFSLDALLDAADGSMQPAAENIELKSRDDYIRVSFTSVDQNMLYAGEFHNSPFFNTHSSHAVNTPDGRQFAYLFGFTVNENNVVVPQIVYSIPDNVQGACFDGTYLYLSQTDRLLSARILCFALDKVPAAGTKNVLGVEVPLYVLCESSSEKSTRIPPMSEEILVVDRKLLILYESASNRYRIGRELGLDHVLATPIEFFQ